MAGVVLKAVEVGDVSVRLKTLMWVLSNSTETLNRKPAEWS